MKKDKNKSRCKNNKNNPMNINIQLNINPQTTSHQEKLQINSQIHKRTSTDRKRFCKTANLDHDFQYFQHEKDNTIQWQRKEKETAIINETYCGKKILNYQNQKTKHQLSTNFRTLEIGKNPKEQETINYFTINNISTNLQDKISFGRKKNYSPTILHNNQKIKKTTKKLNPGHSDHILQSRKNKSNDKKLLNYDNKRQIKNKRQQIITQQRTKIHNKNKHQYKNKQYKISYSKQQQNLKNKLQQFKLDILKLSQIYQHTQLLHQQILTPININNKLTSIKCQTEIQDKIQQMQKYTTIIHNSQIQHNEKNNILFDFSANKNTSKILQTYTKCNQSALLIQNQQQFNLISHIHPVRIEQTAHTSANIQKTDKIINFISFLKQNNNHLTDLSISKIQQYAKQYLNIFSNLKQSKISKNNLLKSDLEINQQIQSLNKVKKSLQIDLLHSEEQKINEWEIRYRKQLLKIKKKMWAQYNIIKQNIQNRITCQQQESNKISNYKLMKSLSQNIIRYNQQTQISISSCSSIGLQIKLYKQPDYFKQFQINHKNYLPTLLHEDDEQDQPQYYYEANEPPNFEDPDISIIGCYDPSQINLISQQKIIQQKIQIGNLNEQKKEQIFQNIFIQLITQIYQQLNLNFNKNNQSSIISKIWSSIKQFIHNFKQSFNLKKIGFSTNISTIRIICEKLINFFSQNTDIDQSGLTIRQKLITNLNTPIGPTNNQLLISLRYNNYQDEPIIIPRFEDYQQRQILEPLLFLNFQHKIINIKELTFDNYYEDQDQQKDRVKFLRNAVHIHHKAIFDCLNELLDQERVYGIWGKPFCWKKIQKFNKMKEDNDLQKILSRCKQNMIQFLKYACGLLVDKQDSIVKGIALQIVQELKQERIRKLIENYNDQLEQRWYFFDDDEAEILLQISHFVWRILINEAIQEILFA